MDSITNKLHVGTSAVHSKSRKRHCSPIHCESGRGADTFKGRLLGVENELVDAIMSGVYPSRSTTSDSHVGTSAVHSKSRKRHCSPVHCESDRDVDTFKGRLLGVEDGLIDAITSGVYPSRPTNQQVLESLTSPAWYSQAKAGMRETRLLGSKEGLHDTLALPAAQYTDTSIGPRASGGLEHRSPHTHPSFKNHKRCSVVNDNTAAHHIWCTCAVDSRWDSISSDDSELEGIYADRAWRSVEIEHVMAGYGTPSTPSFHIHSPSTSEPEVLEQTDTPKELHDILVDSIILERSADVPLLGTWDITNWRTLELTMNDLLVVRK
jgi:hypothetical protein